MLRRLARGPKYVLSTTMPDTGEWNVAVLRSLDPVAIRALADSVDGDMFVGGGKVVDAFRRADLVDEWRIYTHPVVVGGGRPLLTAGRAGAHRHAARHPHRSATACVLTRYATRRDAGLTPAASPIRRH